MEQIEFSGVAWLVIIMLIGLIIGLLSSQLTVKDEDYCDRLEESIRNNKSFQGALACFGPSETGLNVSEAIEGKTEVRCVCMSSYKGEERIFTVNVPS